MPEPSLDWSVVAARVNALTGTFVKVDTLEVVATTRPT